MTLSITLTISIVVFLHTSPHISALCRNFCNNIPINYPFGIDDGCGAAQFRHMLNCSAADLFFLTPSGSYKIQTIDYSKRNVVVFDPSMSTCSILQPHHDFAMTEIQSATIPPSPDTVFALMNCSIDSPVLNHYRSLCFNFSGHSCDELYAACTSFKLFHVLSNATAPPPCCFTRYDTMRFMSMDILDCSHYTSVYNVDGLAGVGPLDWMYGIKLTYNLPDLGCERCAKSGGTCGFDVETLGFACICSTTSNATRDCGNFNLSLSGYIIPNTYLELAYVVHSISNKMNVVFSS
ncbi:hypothetical protein PHJA_000267400 [Phtheirospermum japonicum]|uniref:non-specific serine/threonine protein kinase n=1 Tax=Phtheirospermum japonicum TaxID=374723 RepID=A0A830BGU4_9LAMI|nr:hypothetical protein PHJA_000267400 [Phtheirospermum japonicum]